MIYGKRQAWKALSQYTGVNKDKTLETSAEVAKRLTQEFPFGIPPTEKLLLKAIKKSGIAPITSAYYEISNGQIVDPALQPDMRPESPKFAGEDEALQQSVEAAFDSLAEMAGHPFVRDIPASRELVVKGLIEKFPRGLAPAVIISLAKAGLQQAVSEGYAALRGPSKMVGPQRSASRPSAPTTPEVTPSPSPLQAPSTSVPMTQEQAWKMVALIAGLPDQPDTKEGRASVATALVEKFPNGLSQPAIATAVVRAGLQTTVTMRYDGVREQSTAAPRQQKQRDRHERAL